MSELTQWNTGDISPTPSKQNVKADLYLCIDLSGNYRLFTYVYDIQEWTQNGDDRQKIKLWTKLPKLPEEIQ